MMSVSVFWRARLMAIDETDFDFFFRYDFSTIREQNIRNAENEQTIGRRKKKYDTTISDLLNDSIRINHTFRSILFFCRHAFVLHHIYGGPVQNLWLPHFCSATTLRDTHTNSPEHITKWKKEKIGSQSVNSFSVFLFAAEADERRDDHAPAKSEMGMKKKKICDERMNCFKNQIEFFVFLVCYRSMHMAGIHSHTATHAHTQSRTIHNFKWLIKGDRLHGIRIMYTVYANIIFYRADSYFLRSHSRHFFCTINRHIHRKPPIWLRNVEAHLVGYYRRADLRIDMNVRYVVCDTNEHRWE